MSVSKSLRRLFGIRAIEEEQNRVALESANAELRALKNGLETARARARLGRELATRSASSAEITDRLAARIETEAAERLATALLTRIAVGQAHAARLQRAYLDKRVEKRQAGTLIDEAEAEDVAMAERRGQQNLDDSFGVRVHRKRTDDLERAAASPGFVGSIVLDSADHEMKDSQSPEPNFDVLSRPPS